MGENKHKKGRAIIITIILLLIVVLVGYLLFKNKDSFGVKTSSSISKIFSPLITSNNSKNLNKIDTNSKTVIAQAGENIKKGDSVSITGTNSDNNPIVVKTRNNQDVFGYAKQDINGNELGEVFLRNGGTNTFWSSFSSFLGGLFNNNTNSNNNNNNNVNGNNKVDSNGNCINGAENPPSCTTINGSCINTGTNPPLCTDNGVYCTNGTDNFPLCTTINGVCIGGESNPPLCDINNSNNNGNNVCTNNTTNFPLCTILADGSCSNGSANPPLCNNNGVSCTNGTDNFPLCTTIDGACPGGEINPPLCNSNGVSCTNGAVNYPTCTVDTSNECLNGATNPELCTIDSDNNCLNGATNPELCTNIPGVIHKPDLTVIGNVTPINVAINTPTTISSTITNKGNASTLKSFTSFFSINDGANETIVTSVIPTLEVGVSGLATTSYKFTAVGDYSVRVCADKSSSADDGVIDESNENNNCGSYTTIKVGNSLPEPGTLPQCSDGIDNDGDGKIDQSDPTCHIDGDLSKEWLEDHNSESSTSTDDGTGSDKPQCSDGIDNDGDGKIDMNDSGCHIDGDLTTQQTYVADHDSEIYSPTTPETNICLDIDSRPLEFTATEKAQLADLLRKFYLLAPNLKTEDDIAIAYSEIEQYGNFTDYLDTLVNQCYSQGVGRDSYPNNLDKTPGSVNPKYKGPTARWGNPWFNYERNRFSMDGPYNEGYINLVVNNSTEGECADSIDNDGDGRIDNADPNCHYNGDLSKEWIKSTSTKENSLPPLDCKYISGWFSGRGTDGADCNTYNARLYTTNTPASCVNPLFTEVIDGDPKRPANIPELERANIWYEASANNCIWNNGADIPGLEKVLNIW